MPEQKVALVTGASRGIGRAIAETLAASGFMVAGTATSAAGADSISAYLGEQGKGFALDVCDQAMMDAVHTQICNELGQPAVLVNNAAITADNLFLRMKPAQWSQVIQTNLDSVYYLSKLCLRAMLKARWGRIISITSVVGVVGNPGQANYCAAKAGVIGFSKSLAQEVAAKGITVNTVAPGFIETDMTRSLTKVQQGAILGQIPMKHMGSPVDIANAVDYLASDKASYMTGQTLHVNGGMAMI